MNIARIWFFAVSASFRTYPHCWLYTRATPYLDHALATRTRRGKGGDALQEVAAQSQSHWRFRLPNGLAGLLHVDVEDRFAGNAFESGLAAERGDEPDGSDAILAVGQD